MSGDPLAALSFCGEAMKALNDGDFVISVAVARPEELEGEVLDLYLREIGRQVQAHREKIRSGGRIVIEILHYVPPKRLPQDERGWQPQ